ncbi:MAG: acyltransferase [Hyphomicrobiaceae bacterium]|nr:acyltransferase [Hyphomicrobiaceae bacterium]
MRRADTPTMPSATRPLQPRMLVDMLEPSENSFAVLRLAMALIVLVSHSLWFVSGQRDSDPMTAVTGFTSGEHAVQVFFLLSGFLVAHSLEKTRSPVDFAVARGLRIFPGLIVCVLATALLLGPLVSRLSPQAYALDPALVGYIAKTATLVTASAKLPGVFETVPLSGLVNGSLWTLKFEVLCYLALAGFGAIGLLGAGRRGLATVALVGVIVAASVALPTDTTRYSTVENVAYFAIPFSIGVLGCIWRKSIPVGWIAPLVLAVPAYLAIGTVAQNVTTGLFLGVVAIWLATFRFGPLRAATNRADLSYGVYIYAAPLQQAAIAFIPGIGAAGVTAVVLLPVLALAWLSWTLVEKPAMGLRRGIGARLHRQPGATVDVVSNNRLQRVG